MISTVTVTTTSTGLGILWLFFLTFILSFAVSYLKCKNYSCSIKYSLLISIIMAVIYIILTFILTVPTLNPEIRNINLFNPILTLILIFVAVIPNTIMGILGGLIAVGLKKAPKSKGITSKEISKKLEEKRKTIKI